MHYAKLAKIDGVDDFNRPAKAVEVDRLASAFILSPDLAVFLGNGFNRRGVGGHPLTGGYSLTGYSIITDHRVNHRKCCGAGNLMT